MEELKAGGQETIAKPFQIDLKEVIRNKNPRLLKFLPGFIISFIRRIIHEDEMNDFLQRNHGKMGLDFANAILDEFVTDLAIVGVENIPDTGRYIVAGNHPLGGLDGIALISVVGRKWKNVVFPVNDLLMNIPQLKPLFIPINKHGSNAQNIRILNETFESEKMILYFPAGLVSRKQGGKIRDLTWKKTFITKARQYKRDIIPVYFAGRNSSFFYNLANFRKMLGIKANIEMFFLVDEVYKQKGKNMSMVFGEPISWKTFDRSHPDTYWAQYVMDTVYSLKPQKY